MDLLNSFFGMDEPFMHGVCIIRFVYLFKGLCTNEFAPGMGAK